MFVCICVFINQFKMEGLTGAAFTDFMQVDDQTIRCKINRCSLSIANGIRRMLIAETPTLAIDLIDMIENTGVLHDEFMAHRIGLLPIDSNDLSSFKYRDECESEYLCNECSVDFVCNVTNKGTTNITVTTADFVSQNPKYQMMFNKRDGTELPITKLAPGQTIHFNGIAFKDIGQEHSKWSPVIACTCVYHADTDADKVTQFTQSSEPTEFEFTLETSVAIQPKLALISGLDELIDKLLRFDKSLDLIKF